MMEVAVAVHHVKFVYYHGLVDRRDTGVAVLRTTIAVLRQTQSPQFALSDFLMIHACCLSCCYRIKMSIRNSNHTPLPFKRKEVSATLNLSFCIFRVGHSIWSTPHYPHVKEGAKRLRTGESTKA